MQPGTDLYELTAEGYRKTGYIKSDEEINKETEKKIKERYSASDELKLLRINDRASVDFLAYNAFVEQCRNEGKALKQTAAEERTLLKEVTLPKDELNIERKIFVR